MALKLIRGLHNLQPIAQGCVLTVGNFDGVHLGHQALLNKVKITAKALQIPSVIMTFEPLPKEYFGQDAKIPRLTRWREKFDFISRCGLDYLFVIHFNEEFSHLSSDDFVKSILVGSLHVKHMIVGDDFRFGKNREGDFALLKQLGATYDFTIENMPSLMVDQQRVSSTLVRNALECGDQQLAEKLLGRSYTMQGRVVHGNARGRILGFPTANIYLHRQVTPVKGVYAVRMHGIETESLPGVANVGIRPTIGGKRTILEVHLFDFDGDLYGRHVSVEFCKKLRDEKRFDNLELLKQQIWKDAEEARHYFVKRGVSNE